MKKLELLGGLTPAQFLRDYWHKKPLLIRQAIPGFQAPLPRQELFDLARRDEVESRLITHRADGWDMQHGPVDKLPALKQKAWTLLVQGVNLHHPAADELLRQFRFISDARLDDLMISYASDGGGVGPHFDSYDVFLLQAHGQRRWRISAQEDLTLEEGVPLKILSNFQPEEEFVLEPGDMLYLPPHYAHDGVAVGECMTYSIGFRAPAYQELGEAFLEFMMDTIDLPGRYADPDLKPSAKPAELPVEMLARIRDEINKIRFTDDDITIFLGEHLSTPKASVFFEPPAEELSFARFFQGAKKRGLRLHRKTQMLYRGANVFINGESFQVGRADKGILAALADRRQLGKTEFENASEDLLEALHQWHESGWLEFN
ncbi:cupin domain-containing protein [Herbaspirillum sp. LeCh32-8]|uniref:cupin domain-containing protein n=1 Tax=Herbaspirillum sp. LeCh32-8 TaxID=2821356 RepID=UPI001AEB27B0|nr:cupin domain-containing protein [Herbaspirillum sp. LeCh32-8]MBP0599337.1 cupin domain-containing protein [Herbaspirillum sp. LeCh32-8]